jgi:monofunctional biosynthetic peptidoglycan transglycosylase
LAAVLFWFLSLPWPFLLRWHEPARTSFVEYRLEEARRADEPLEIRHEWVELSEISTELREAVLISEDDRFYDHEGVDWKALAEELDYQGDTVFSWLDPGDWKAVWDAVGYYRTHRDDVRGRSTLTQQLAKNLYFTPRRSLFRKASELVVAKRLEWFLSKDRILELYLNLVEWGPGIFGAEAAAQSYFGVPASRLTGRQGAALAATLPHPLTSNPSYRPARMEWRADLILQRLEGADLPPLPDPPPLVEIDLEGSFDTLGLPPAKDSSGGT